MLALVFLAFFPQVNNWNSKYIEDLLSAFCWKKSIIFNFRLLLGQYVDNMQVGLPLFLYMYPPLKLFSSFKLSLLVQIKLCSTFSTVIESLLSTWNDLSLPKPCTGRLPLRFGVSLGENLIPFRAQSCGIAMPSSAFHFRF